MDMGSTLNFLVTTLINISELQLRKDFEINKHDYGLPPDSIAQLMAPPPNLLSSSLEE